MKSLLAFCTLVFSISYYAHAILPATPALEQKWQSVVFLEIPGFDVDGSPLDAECNGTLIAANTLVTAAHCLIESTIEKGASLKLTVGEYLFKRNPDGSLFRVGYVPKIKHQSTVSVKFVSGVNFHSQPNRIPPESDFVFIHLNTPVPVPADFIFAKIWNQAVTAQSFTNPTVVTINLHDYMTSNDSKQFAVLNQIRFSNYSAQSTSNSRVNPGDSGAPLFVTANGKEYVVGVTKGQARTAFSNWDAFAIWGQRAKRRGF